MFFVLLTPGNFIPSIFPVSTVSAVLDNEQDMANNLDQKS